MCVWCLMASIPAFQAGGTSSNLATHSRLLVQNLKFAISVWNDNSGRAEPFIWSLHNNGKLYDLRKSGEPHSKPPLTY